MRQAMPVAPKGMVEKPWVDFGPGYIQRVVHLFPKQGDREPWLNTQNYKRDRKALKNNPIDDGHMRFSNPRIAEISEAAQ